MNRPRRLVAWCVLLQTVGLSNLLRGESAAYRLPPEPIPAMVTRPPTPSLLVGPDHRVGLLVYRESLPPIAELARPMLRLAGKRFYPELRLPATRSGGPVVRLEFLDLETGRKWAAKLPEESEVAWFSWSPNGLRVALARVASHGVELWVVDARSGACDRVTDSRLNLVSGPCEWLPDSERLLCRFVPDGLDAPPSPPRVPQGPIIQETGGVRAQVRTFQDLLESPFDERLYEYYASSQPSVVDLNGARRNVGSPGLYGAIEVSPDGRFFLVERIHRPFSYVVPEDYFPRSVEIWGVRGSLVRVLVDLPLAEDVPIGGVRTGPRNYGWLPYGPPALVWLEALDGGDPKAEADYRDRILLWLEPFVRAPGEIYRAEWRIRDLQWLEDRSWLLTEWDRDRQWVRTWLLDARKGKSVPPRKLWDRGLYDAYADPGRPVQWPSPSGKRVVVQAEEWIYLAGRGGSPEGDRPFLRRFSLRTGVTEDVFTCREKRYEYPEELLNREGTSVLVSSEAPDDPPDYFVFDAVTNTFRELTQFPDPTPELRGVRKELVTYTREDGLLLSGTLYLPPGYESGQVLPLVLWAYPREYNDPAVASQVRGSPFGYARVSGASHLYFLTQGYAVLDGPSMPIVGEDGNDTFVEQLVMSAKAAVDRMVALGVTEPGRIGVGGHSYGAFMTANLLAHSDFFAAGIARSGAYNRTLTPFGFQNERRTFWEAPEVYFSMSPFMHADKIKEPLLLIHGQADNNSGTFPLQSERLFHALKGSGGTARLVLLPHESHAYVARESVLHVLAEMVDWFDRYVKEPAK